MLKKIISRSFVVVTSIFHDGWSWFGTPDGGPTVDGLDRLIISVALDQSTDFLVEVHFVDTQ